MISRFAAKRLVKLGHVADNTVYAEYYRPLGKGPFPCTIILGITALLLFAGFETTMAVHDQRCFERPTPVRHRRYPPPLRQ